MDLIELPLNCGVKYVKNFLTKDECDKYYEYMIKIPQFIKKEHEGRKTALFGSVDSYKYAKNNEKPIPYNDCPFLLIIKDKLNDLLGINFNICLCNLYENGNKKFSFHSDNEEIGKVTPIASISIGAERYFYFKKKKNVLSDGPDEYKILLENGSLLIMDSICQEKYMHSLPRDNKIKSPRINITYRYQN
jgi:alkylated DNA repair dioxygenase AlkB